METHGDGPANEGTPGPQSPVTDSATDAPATDAPATDAPATDAPATDAPVTDAPRADAKAAPAASGDETRTALPAKVEAWRRRSAAGAILTGFALGLQQALEPKRDEPSIVVQTSGDPPDDLPVEADFEYGRPRQSVVSIRPWLLDRPSEDSPDGPSADAPDRPTQDASDRPTGDAPDHPGRRAGDEAE